MRLKICLGVYAGTLHYTTGADTWQLLARCAASTEPPAGEGMSTRKQGAVVHHDDLAAHRDGAQAGAGAKRCRADALRSPEAQ